MGRWQSDYYDQVLGQKLKSLVCGAITRAKLEQGDSDAPPAITYETFVQNLDHGDSFTTMLVEILVKEMADRQERPSSDRHQVARRTLRSLRTLANRTPWGGRNFSDLYISRGGGELPDSGDWGMLTRDDVDIDEMVPPTPPPVHRFSSIDHSTGFNAFFGDAMPTRRSFPVQTGEVETDEEMPNGDSEPMRRSSIISRSSMPARATTVTRQPSIRRANRSRLPPANINEASFTEFAARRRHAGRLEQEDNFRPPGLNSGESSMDLTNILHGNHSHRNPSEEHDRPFTAAVFPGVVTRGGLPRARPQNGPGTSNDNLPHSRYTTFHPSSSAPGASTSRPAVNYPRLRRGSIRAPESLPTAGDGYLHSVRISSPPIPGLSYGSDENEDTRRSSPIHLTETSVAPSEGSNTSAAAWPSLSDSNSRTESMGRPSAQVPDTSGATTNLPTPRSISPEASS